MERILLRKELLLSDALDLRRESNRIPCAWRRLWWSIHGLETSSRRPALANVFMMELTAFESPRLRCRTRYSTNDIRIASNHNPASLEDRLRVSTAFSSLGDLLEVSMYLWRNVGHVIVWVLVMISHEYVSWLWYQLWALVVVAYISGTLFWPYQHTSNQAVNLWFQDSSLGEWENYLYTLGQWGFFWILWADQSLWNIFLCSLQIFLILNSHYDNRLSNSRNNRLGLLVVIVEIHPLSGCQDHPQALS